MEDSRGAAPETGPLEPEEAARANLYGLVSRLFYGPPDPNLLAEICRAGGGEPSEAEGGLPAEWGRLKEACRSVYPPVARQEYDGLFVGVGKAAITPYLSAYAEPHSPDRFVVRLRDRLAGWQLGRRVSVFEVEDHVSGLSD